MTEHRVLIRAGEPAGGRTGVTHAAGVSAASAGAMWSGDQEAGR